MKKIVFFALLGTMTLGACDKNNNIVLFSVQNDKDLGAQVAAEIEANPTEYPILSETEYPEAYQYIRNMTNTILNSGQVQYKDEFAWQVKIIHDDEVLNAFCTPGGYIYVYTGLIKYLDKADDLAGVMGHEIAHADLRHTSRNLQKQYGVSVLLSVILGESSSELATIAGQIAGTGAALAFSRDFEREADDNSVVYLAGTDYACNGAAYFFQKLIDGGQSGGTPQFLSTHPNPDNRVEDINAKADEEGCDKTPIAPDTYQDFKNSLPQ